jgi:hypothetical protein
MKIFTSVLVVIERCTLIIFNITLLDFDHLLGNSVVALIGIAASLCAVFILLIFRMSKMIEEKSKTINNV